MALVTVSVIRRVVHNNFFLFIIILKMVITCTHVVLLMNLGRITKNNFHCDFETP